MEKKPRHHPTRKHPSGGYILCENKTKCSFCRTFRGVVMFDTFQSNLKKFKKADSWFNFNLDFYIAPDEVVTAASFDTAFRGLFHSLPESILLTFKQSDIFVFSTFHGLCWNEDYHRFTVHFFIRKKLNRQFYLKFHRFVNQSNSSFNLAPEFSEWNYEDFSSLAHRMKLLSLKNFDLVTQSNLPEPTQKWLISRTHRPICRMYFCLNRKILSKFFKPIFVFKDGV